MKALKQFVVTTLVGGIVFLIPLGLVLLVLKHAMSIAAGIGKPVVALFPTSHVGGIAVGTLVAVAILMLFAFLAGMVARTPAGRKVTRWFEDSLLGGLPQYQMAKTLADGFATVEGGADLQPVLVLIDEGWQIAYRLGDLPGGWVAVFVPQSPTPMSGSVMYVESHRVRDAHLSMKEALVLVKRLGVGSDTALRGVDLTLPAASSPG
jgi:uncharacterized membrane protein